MLTAFRARRREQAEARRRAILGPAFDRAVAAAEEVIAAADHLGDSLEVVVEADWGRWSDAWDRLGDALDARDLAQAGLAALDPLLASRLAAYYAPEIRAGTYTAA